MLVHATAVDDCSSGTRKYCGVGPAFSTYIINDASPEHACVAKSVLQVELGLGPGLDKSGPDPDRIGSKFGCTS